MKRSDGSNVPSGASYVANEILTVSVSSFSLDILFQSYGASFINGFSCTAGGATSRVAASGSVYGGTTNYGIVTSAPYTSGHATIQMPSSGSVSLIAAFASGKGTVRISPTFTLTEPSETTTTTKPSASPTSTITTTTTTTTLTIITYIIILFHK